MWIFMCKEQPGKNNHSGEAHEWSGFKKSSLVSHVAVRGQNSWDEAGDNIAEQQLKDWVVNSLHVRKLDPTKFVK